MNARERDERKLLRAARMTERAERIEQTMDARASFDPRKLKRVNRLLHKAGRIVKVRGLRYAANGYRTRP